MMIKGYSIAPRAIAALVIAVAVVIVLLWAPAAWRSHKTEAKQAEVDKGQAGAAADTGVEAVNTMGEIINLGAESDRTVDEGKAAVRAAPEADRGRVTVDSACKMRAYRDTPRCKGKRP